MALSATLSLIILPLTFWTLATVSFLSISFSTATPLPSPEATQFSDSQNSSKQHSRENDIPIKEPVRESQNQGFFVDVSTAGSRIFTSSSSEGESSTLLTVVQKENVRNSSGGFYKNKPSLNIDAEKDRLRKTPCEKESEGCESRKADDNDDDKLDVELELEVPGFNSFDNLSIGSTQKSPDINMSGVLSINGETQPKTNLTDYNNPTKFTTTVNILLNTHTVNNKDPSPTSAPKTSKITEQITSSNIVTQSIPIQPTLTTTDKTALTSPKPTRKTVSRPSKGKGHTKKVKGQRGGKKEGAGITKSGMSSAPSHHLAKHFTGFVQHVWLPNSTPRQPGPLDDGPFGSIFWRDKKYLVSVLIPIGVGFIGAMMIIVMAYASRAWRKRKERLAQAQGLPGSFLEAASSKNDDMAPLHESSDDEF